MGRLPEDRQGPWWSHRTSPRSGGPRVRTNASKAQISSFCAKSKNQPNPMPTKPPKPNSNQFQPPNQPSNSLFSLPSHQPSFQPTLQIRIPRRRWLSPTALCNHRWWDPVADRQRPPCCLLSAPPEGSLVGSSGAWDHWWRLGLFF